MERYYCYLLTWVLGPISRLRANSPLVDFCTNTAEYKNTWQKVEVLDVGHTLLRMALQLHFNKTERCHYNLQVIGLNLRECLTVAVTHKPTMLSYSYDN